METPFNDIQPPQDFPAAAFAFMAEDDAQVLPETEEGYDDEDARLLVLYAGMPAPIEWN